MRLLDRTALVTGASRGIGRAMALALAAEGVDVAVNYLCSETPAKQLVKEIAEMGRQALLIQGDVGNYDDACHMAREIASGFGHLDILINNAGVTSDRSFSKMDQAAWRKVMGPGRERHLGDWPDRQLWPGELRLVQSRRGCLHQVTCQGDGGEGHHG